jgi:hypothetical protein
MQSKAKTVKEYLEELSKDRREALEKVRRVIRKNLPKGYEESMQYGMIGYGVPLKLYPAGYLGDKKTLLPYAALASQKNHMAVYLMNIYGNKETQKWFDGEVEKWQNVAPRQARGKKKLDMGKSCVRFRKIDDLPLDLIGKAVAKTSVKKCIEIYEKSRKKEKAM